METAYFVQTIGWVAMALGVIRFQMRTTRQMRFFNFMAAFLWAVHYAGMGSLVASTLCFIASGRSLALLHPFVWRRKGMVALSVIILCGGASLSQFTSWIDILPFTGLVCGSLIDIQKRALAARGIGFCGQITWLTFNALIGSYGGIANSAFKIVSNITGLIRHHVLPQTGKPRSHYFFQPLQNIGLFRLNKTATAPYRARN